MFSVPGVKEKFELSVGTVEKVPGFEVSVLKPKQIKSLSSKEWMLPW